MKKAKTKQESVWRILGWKHILVCTLCCLLFLGMLLLNFWELMQLGQENTYRNCQNSYLLAAGELDDYLRLTNQAVDSAARRIEEMRAGGASNEEIRAYMTRESGNLDDRIAGETTVVYGYIDGTFLYGGDWEPDADFDATTRPWYGKAVQEAGRVTHVPPYVDLVTGLQTITVCKALSDGTSVVSMDLSTQKLQNVVDELVSSRDYFDGDTSSYGYTQIFVMDDEGAIIAHSDETKQLGNFLVSDDPVEREIAEHILVSGETFFRIKINGEPMVFCGGDVEGGWYVFSALEYGEVNARILRNLYLSIGAALLGIAGMIVVMARLALRRYHENIIRDYATEVEEENQRLEEKAAAALKIAELTQSVTALLANMPGMSSSKEVESGKYLACNQAFAEFANRKSPEDVIGLTDEDIFDAETAKRFAADDAKALSMDQPYSFYEETPDAAGKTRQFQTTKLKFTDASGRLCALCMRLDYTELTRVKRETAEARAAYEREHNASQLYSHIAQALSSNYNYLFYVNLRTDEYIEYQNSQDADQASKEGRGDNFFGSRREKAGSIVHPEDRELFVKSFTKENILRCLSEDGAFTLTYRHLIDGEVTYVTLTVSQLQNDDEHIFVGVKSEENIEARNEMTGLRSEMALYVRGKELLHAHPDWCVIALDLEHFKLFNEWYGREMGDQLLTQIGELLVRVENTTGGLSCYLGQDDFALVTPYDEEKIRQLFGEIHGFIMEWGNSVGFLPAIGVCMADGQASVQELFDRASQAGQHAKEDYHHRIRVFEKSMYEKTEQDYQILSDFQQALADQELFIQLQPQCRIESGKVVGAESLVRWKKADGKMISPGVFVPVLEQYGFVTDLDQFVWEEVCAWQKRWIDAGHTPLPVSVNVSQIDIFTIDVPAYFELLLWKYRLPVNVIKIEITESAYVGDGLVADTVRRLREKGFLVLMDDFGSGYSSLNMLRSLSVDVIKLDAKFLRMSSDDQKGVRILESIVGMAKSMEAPIIVEGVETEEETEFIKNLGCHYVQGYHFYRPMPVADFEALIGEPANIDTRGYTLE